MTMIFCEGFEQYADATDFERGPWVATLPGGITGFSAGRYGGQRLDLHGANMNKSIVPSNYTTEYWLGFAVIFTGSMVGWNIIRFLSDTSSEHVQLEITAAGELEFRQAGTLLEATSGLGLLTSVWYYMEIHVVIDDAVGEFEVRVNGNVELGPATGQDTEGTISPNVASIQFLQNSSAAPSYDDIYLNDNTGLTNNDFLGDIQVETVFPDADGNRNDMTRVGGGLANFEAVDDGSAPDDDATYVHGNTVGDDELYSFADLTGNGFGIDTIHAVAVVNHFKKIDAGDRIVRALARSNVTEVEGAEHGCGPDYRYNQHIYETDPDGGGAWDEDAVNDAEFGITIEA